MEHQKAVLAAKLTEEIEFDETADYIGIDKGALALAEQNIHMKVAIGDFDSVNVRELELIRANADETILLDPIKDETDTESALNFVKEQGYDKIEIVGGMNGRADHFMANIMLVYRSEQNIILKDANNRIRRLKEGLHTINKSDYKYLSFIAFEDVEISLEGVYYPLDHKAITLGDIFTVSNEITAEYATISIYKGTVILFETKDGEE